MNEIAIREALVFVGAVAGAVWGYCLGKLLERRRLAGEVRPSLEALERWAVDVCEGLEGLERSLLRSSAANEHHVPRLSEERAVGVVTEPAAGRGVRSLISRLRTVP